MGNDALKDAGILARRFNAWTERAILRGSAMGEKLEQGLQGSEKILLSTLGAVALESAEPVCDIWRAETYTQVFTRIADADAVGFLFKMLDSPPDANADTWAADHISALRQNGAPAFAGIMSPGSRARIRAKNLVTPG